MGGTAEGILVGFALPKHFELAIVVPVFIVLVALHVDGKTSFDIFTTKRTFPQFSHLLFRGLLLSSRHG